MNSKNDQSAEISIDDDAELFALEHLLDVGNEEAQAKETIPPKQNVPTAPPRLIEDSSFADAFSYELNLPEETVQKVAIGTTSKVDDFDSSDDEEIKNFLERKYNEYGSDINKKLKQQQQAKHEAKVANEVSKLSSVGNNSVTNGGISTKPASPVCHIKNPHNPINRRSLVSRSFKTQPKEEARNVHTRAESTILDKRSAKPFNTLSTSTVYTDPVFGLRIINPLVSSAVLVERMSGRKAIPFSGVAFHTQRGDLSKDWVIAGALISKSPIKLSAKGVPFSIWRLSDLKGEIIKISLFLFGGAHKDLWKTTTGTCLAILNPSVFEKRAESGDAACLSIDTSQKVMILGQSKDMGVCKSKKKNGDPCTAIINLGDCDYCLYHVKQEFGKMSQRSELQSANAGRGLNELRNKVLGKSEVFYGGQSFTAIPAKKSAKQTAKDQKRIMSLSEYAVSPNAGSINHTSKTKNAIVNVPYASRDGRISKIASTVETTTKQRLKDLERLKALQAESSKSTVEKEKSPITSNLNQLGNKQDICSLNSTNTMTSNTPDKFKNRSFSTASPKLSNDNFCIEVNIDSRKAQLAKVKATQILKNKPIEKVNPNSIRGSKDGKKRAIDELNERFDSATKRQKIDEEQKEAERKTRIQRIMDATSSHTNLVEMREQQEQDKYFNKLEKKEALEEKMLNTYKMPCKAVICIKCKYTAFSASDRCKEEKHTLKVVDAEKRFFQCKDCGNRTTTVFKFPKTSCTNCKGSRWMRAAMIRERKICDGTEGLSLRGDEEQFIGSLSGKASLNLLVPDE